MIITARGRALRPEPRPSPVVDQCQKAPTSWRMISILGTDGKSYGPVAADQVRRWLSEGRASLETLGQRQGEDSWTPLGEFHEFNPSLPPPLPASAPYPPPLPDAAEDETAAMPEDREVVRLASRARRLVASFIDTALSTFFALPGLAMLTIGVLGDTRSFDELADKGFPGHETAMAVIMFGMLIPTIAQIILLSWRGQTVGKLLMQMRIVRADDGENPGFMRAVVLRGIVPALIGTIPAVGILFTLVDALAIFRRDCRCVHDHIAGTIVVDTQEPDTDEKD